MASTAGSAEVVALSEVKGTIAENAIDVTADADITTLVYVNGALTCTYSGATGKYEVTATP